jgi:O-antigen/teichoic acid export membrane protein
MSEIVSKSFQKIAKGSTVVFIGTAINLLLSFFTRVIMARFSTQAEYGIYSLVLTVVSICTTISALGLEEGAARSIAYLRGEKGKKNVQDIIFSSIIFALMASTLMIILIFFTSDYLAVKVFNEPSMSFVLQIMAISIPFTVLINIIISIYRGFDKASIKTYFNNILRPSIYFLLLGIAVLLNQSFVEMISIYVMSFLITFLLLIVYFIKHAPIKLIPKEIHINHNTKKLLSFSIPLLTISLLLTIMTWTDTLMLGYFKTAETVAAYNAAHPVANLLSVGINSIGFLYLPITSNLYSNNSIKEIGILNESSTKWCFLITLPIFFMLIVFPEFILNLFYGSEYVTASNVLQVLALGFMANSFFGLNYYTLMATGKSRLLMHCSLMSAIANIILNLILIPSFGMLGAAIASAISFTLIEIYMTLKLYQLLGIHPFTKVYLRFTTFAISSVLIFYIFRSLFIHTFSTIVLSYTLFLVVYSITILGTKSLDKEDVEILTKIEKKLLHVFQLSRKYY